MAANDGVQDMGPPTIEGIAQVLGISEDKILNAYIYGSRLFGTASPSSDYDVYVVLDGSCGPLTKPDGCSGSNELYGLSEKLVECNNWDINVRSSHFWKYLVMIHNIQTLVCQHYMPAEKRLKQTTTYPWHFEYMILKHEVYSYTHEHEEKAQNLWKKQKIDKAKKTIIHALREMLFGIQLATEGRIYDITDGNQYFFEIMQLPVKSWADLQAWYKPIWDSLMDKFTAIVNIYKEFQFNISPHSEIETVQYFKALIQKSSPSSVDAGMQNLCKELSIKVVRNHRHSNLLEFHMIPPSSPARSPVVKQSLGLVLDKSANFAVTAFPVTKFFNFNEDEYAEEKYVPSIDWNSTVLYQKPCGLSICLFFYQDGWNISCHCGASVYSTQYCLKHNTEKHNITSLVEKPFWDLWNALGRKMPSNPKLCFMFVARFEDSTLKLVAVRDLVSLQEVPHEPIGEEYEWDYVKPVPFSDIGVDMKTISLDNNSNTSAGPYAIEKRIQQQTYHFSPLEVEGYVAKDASGTRIKILSPQYLAVSELDPFEYYKNLEKKILQILRYLVRFDQEALFADQVIQWRNWMTHVGTLFRKMCAQLNETYIPIKHIEDKKDFAQSAPKNKYTQLHFHLKGHGAATAEEYFCDFSIMNDGKVTRQIEQFLFDPKFNSNLL